MKIVVTGNPNYEGLCKGIYEAYNHNFVEFIGRYNGWDLTDFDKVAEYVKDHGGIDLIVERQYLNSTIGTLLNVLLKKAEAQAKQESNVTVHQSLQSAS